MPKISTDPSSLTVEENEQSVLTCGYESKSDKYTTIKWRKGGKVLKLEDYGMFGGNYAPFS